jgi:hypothetical protein
MGESVSVNGTPQIIVVRKPKSSPMDQANKGRATAIIQIIKVWGWGETVKQSIPLLTARVNIFE